MPRRVRKQEMQPQAPETCERGISKYADDIQLLIEVNGVMPWTFKPQKKAWEIIAKKLVEATGLKKAHGPCQQRFNHLVRQHRDKNKASARKSGHAEEYSERMRLLDDIINVMDDYESEQERAKETRAIQADALDESGRVMREEACGSAAPPAKKTKRTAYNRVINAIDEAFESSDDMELRREELQARREEIQLIQQQLATQAAMQQQQIQQQASLQADLQAEVESRQAQLTTVIELLSRNISERK